MPEVGPCTGLIGYIHFHGGFDLFGETNLALDSPFLQLIRKRVPARIIANGRTDHTGWYSPLAQYTGNDRRIIKYKFAEFPNEGASIMPGQSIEHHNGDRGQHAKAHISRRNFLSI